LKIFLGYCYVYSVVKMYTCNVVFLDNNIYCTLALLDLNIHGWNCFFLKIFYIIPSSYVVQNFLNDFEMVPVVITITVTLRLLHSTQTLVQLIFIYT